MLAVAGFVTVILSVVAYVWAINQPYRYDGLTDAAKPWWACVVAVFLFATSVIFGLAAAPTSVLTSPTFLKLRSVSGVKTIGAQRVVIALLAVAPLGLLLLTFMSL